MHRTFPRAIGLAALVLACTVTQARAQTGADAIVGLTFGRPLVLDGVDGHNVGRLALAAGVPIGLESVSPARRRSWTVPATGRPLREVLDRVVVADPRYAWRDDDGVIVLSPKAGSAAQPLLNSHVGSLALRDVDALGAYDAVLRLFGLPPLSGIGLGDTKRFSLEVPEGSTFQQMLNAIVRAHGTLAWVLQATIPHHPERPLTFHVFTGPQGLGTPVPGRPFFYRTHSVNLATPGQSTRTDAQVPLLDRVVGTDVFGKPVVLYGALAPDVARLAAAVRVPMGIQTMPEDDDARPQYMSAGVTVTGVPLGAVLRGLNTTAKGYEWRELDGVIVFRPIAAWTDPEDALFRLVPNVQLTDAPVSEAIGALLSHVGSPERAATTQFSDSRRISVDFAQGTVLDLLNLIVKAHGEMSWHWHELSRAERESWHPTRVRRELTFSLFRGIAKGYPLP